MSNLIGKKLTVIKGCNDLNIKKGAVISILAVDLLGAEYSHSVGITFKVSGRKCRMYARHVNRLSDTSFNLNNGNPLKKITVT